VLELLFRQSGGLLDVTRLSKESQISRPTVTNWLEVYQVTQVVRLIRPFSAGGRREITAQPKAFGFDTGFVCHARGWDTLRPDDHGILWEHLVLEALVASATPQVFFWRDKQQREIDFVVPGGRKSVDAIECNWRPDAFEPRGLMAFRDNYPRGRNFVVCPLHGPGFDRVIKKLPVSFVSPGELRALLAAR
jgi:predicted AAA+ superfamily ATPase